MRKKGKIINSVLKNQLKTAFQVSNLSKEERCITEKSFRLISEIRAEYENLSIWKEYTPYIPEKKRRKNATCTEFLKGLLQEIGFPIENGVPMEDPSNEIFESNLFPVSKFLDPMTPLIMCLTQKQALEIIDVEVRECNKIWMCDFSIFIPDGKDKKLFSERMLDKILEGKAGRKYGINKAKKNINNPNEGLVNEIN